MNGHQELREALAELLLQAETAELNRGTDWITTARAQFQVAMDGARLALAKHEQAYHARGAAQLRHWTCRECSYQFDGGGNGVTYCPSCCKATLTEYVPSEPGADTGTTPPVEGDEICRKCGDDNCQCPAHAECPTCGYAQWEWRGEAACSNPFHAQPAERGTTPPEGLDAASIIEAVYQDLGTTGTICMTTYARISRWRAARAATQRAPVEQGPKAVLITDDGRPRLILKCPQCGWNTPKYLNVQGLGCSECNPSRNVPATAPDHAREGALREALKRIPESVFALYLDYKQREVVRAALADGKEGGE